MGRLVRPLLLAALGLMNPVEGLGAGDREESWHYLNECDWVGVSVERAVYFRPDTDHFFVRVRLENKSDREIGVNLEYHRCISPNQWGVHRQDQRILVDESRVEPKPLEPAEAKAFLVAFRAKETVAIPPGKSVTYFRDFNGPAGTGRGKIDSSEGKFLIISMDGVLDFTDGKSIQRVDLEWKGNFGADESDLVIPFPPVWREVPDVAVVVEDR